MMKPKAKPAIKYLGNYTQAAPYVVEAHDPVRDLWHIRTTDNLIIGPIYGRGTANLFAAAPELLGALRVAATECANADVDSIERLKDLAQNWIKLVGKCEGQLR